MSKRCFVIQKFDGDKYDSLYEQVFKPAIEAAGFIPYRVDEDPSASIPIETIEQKITDSDACFIEISEDAPNVWFELGYAIARDKPLCLVCSSTREKFPFDVQHRKIIKYPVESVPSDYAALSKSIESRLTSIVKNDLARQQNTDAAKALAVSPETSGLKPHELLALTIVFQSQFTNGISGWSLNNEMERSGYTGVASALALSGLKRKKYIETRTVEDQNGNVYDSLFVAELGEGWLINHQDELNLKIDKIVDEDIPF